ncbi:hypothetical protein JZ751_026907 [Albula glossodonta]|uniref:D-aminoacyl-tRNA deacylase n=1 Tax=Albula glossodonta TaxID=121402 RepID=A0A8T2PHA1_9TELE|nr:hypothetical protein JZ751_026907 [Albula glossodonta]
MMGYCGISGSGMLGNWVSPPEKGYRALNGQFGAYMQVHIQNDGPVTIELESPTGPMDPKQVLSQAEDLEHIVLVKRGSQKSCALIERVMGRVRAGTISDEPVQEMELRMRLDKQGLCHVAHPGTSGTRCAQLTPHSVSMETALWWEAAHSPVTSVKFRCARRAA